MTSLGFGAWQITEVQRLEGTSGDDLCQPPAKAGSLQQVAVLGLSAGGEHKGSISSVVTVLQVN